MEEVREEDGEKEECESPDASNIESKKASEVVIKSPPQGNSHLNGWWSRVKRGFVSCVVTSAACFGSLICFPCRLWLYSISNGSTLFRVYGTSYHTDGDSPLVNEKFKVKTLPPRGGVIGNGGFGTAASGGRGNND